MLNATNVVRAKSPATVVQNAAKPQSTRVRIATRPDVRDKPLVPAMTDVMQCDTKSFVNVEQHVNKCAHVCCQDRNRPLMFSNDPRHFGGFDCCDMTCSICEDEDFVKLVDQEFVSESKGDKAVAVVEIAK